MRRQAIAAVLFSVLFAAVSSAQVIYEPVQSQYRYAGSNPRVFEYARQRLDCFRDGRHTRDGRYGVGYLRRGLIGEPYQYTFSDCAPYRNAVVFGYTAVDARNEAYARAPQFFRMGELIEFAVPSADGVGVVVPAQARGTIDIRVVRPATRPATGPGTEPRPVMVIPKKALETPAKADELLTSAR